MEVAVRRDVVMVVLVVLVVVVVVLVLVVVVVVGVWVVVSGWWLVVKLCQQSWPKAGAPDAPEK